MSSTADKYIQERNDVSRNLDTLKDKDNELLKESLPKENDLKNLKKEIEDAKAFIAQAENAKANFGDDKSLKELQVSDLKKEMDELKEIQTKTMQQLDDAKTAIDTMTMM